MSSREERERLKEVYKDHYRKMRETTEEFRKQRRKASIMKALANMDNTELMESFDNVLEGLQEKISRVEARLEVAMEGLGDEDQEASYPSDAERKQRTADFEQQQKRKKARQTLRNIRDEMGQLYNELEEQARELKARKTVGTESEGDQASEDKNESSGTSQQTSQRQKNR